MVLCRLTHQPPTTGGKKEDQSLLAVTARSETEKALCLSWGVFPLHTEEMHNVDQMLEVVKMMAVLQGHLTSGDCLVITAGTPLGTTPRKYVGIIWKLAMDLKPVCGMGPTKFRLKNFEGAPYHGGAAEMPPSIENRNNFRTNNTDQGGDWGG